MRGRLGDFVDVDGELIKVDKDSLRNAALQEIRVTHFVGGKDGRASEKTTTIKLHNLVTAISKLAEMTPGAYETVKVDMTPGLEELLRKLQGRKELPEGGE